MPSLSSYDKGKKSHRAKTYLKDVNAGNEAMSEFWQVLKQEWPEHRTEAEFVILKGNHEDRRERALEYGPDELLDLLEAFDFNYSGWNKVVPFLKIHRWKGIEFSHYFRNPGSARPLSTARMLLLKRHVSSIAGHKQGFDYAEMLSGGKSIIQSLIIGSCYFHNESYLTHTNHHWRGTVILKNVKRGQFDFVRFSLSELAEEYGSEL